jgi:two-component system cell cycle response regulator
MSARILVIEDNAANLELMTYLLGAFGHTVTSACDGEDGLRMATRDKPDLIVCDVHLPKMGGYEVVRQLKADLTCRSIPTVAVTALAMVGDRDRVLEAGFDGYLAKPIDPETFVSQIEAYLGSNRAPATPVRANDSMVELSRPSPNPATVLVVDNAQASLLLARGILEPFGYRVIEASTPREGLGKASQSLPDLILTDICMSEGDGYEFIQRVKADARLAKIPFVFITSSMMEEDRARGLSLGAVRFLRRPIEPENLLAEIESCLREAR